MALFGKKEAPGEEGALEVYKVAYKGGHPQLPKAKIGEIRLVLAPGEFRLNPTIGSKNFWTQLTIPYAAVNGVQIVARQESTFESLLGGADAKPLNQENNIHLDYLDPAGTPSLLRFEMITGVTVNGQATKCREFTDRLRTHGILDQFRAQPAAAGAAGDLADQLGKLASLRDQGILTHDEFSAKKAELLSRM
jgi:hypothetical protein